MTEEPRYTALWDQLNTHRREWAQTVVDHYAQLKAGGLPDHLVDTLVWDYHHITYQTMMDRTQGGNAE